jgi:hypothetical protein
MHFDQLTGFGPGPFATSRPKIANALNLPSHITLLCAVPKMDEKLMDYRQWKKNIPMCYDFFINNNLILPSPCIRWGHTIREDSMSLLQRYHSMASFTATWIDIFAPGFITRKEEESRIQ